MFSQADIGFATDVRRWFITFFSTTRWIINTFQVYKKLSLKNVTIDTYAWADTDKEDLSHGRFRFFGDTDIEIITDSNDISEVHLSSESNVKFIKMNGDLEIKYNIKSMDWTITIDGNGFVTKDIKGKLTGSMTVDPVRFIGSKKVNIYYSNLVTLIDVEITS